MSDLICPKIAPAPNGGILQGLYPGDNAPAGALDNFKNMSGVDVDIELHFTPFTNLRFPHEKARRLAAKNRALYIKLEPFNPIAWKSRAKQDEDIRVLRIHEGKGGTLNKDYSLEKITGAVAKWFFSDKQDQIWNALLKAGYVDNIGIVKPEFESLSRDEFAASFNPEGDALTDREKGQIFNILQKALQDKKSWEEQLKRFAQEIKNFGKPVFVSFAHEMNTFFYPWAGSPELYRAAWRHVHDVMSSVFPPGTCSNITWVWNPNAGSSEMYFPEELPEQQHKYVDWVGVDGYNRTGKQSIPRIFSSSLRYLRSLGKPIMIGEFGCADDNTACLTDFVEYATDPENAINAFIYFNMSKTGPWEDTWAITTRAEQKAYKDALAKNTSLFTDSFQIGKIPFVSLAPKLELSLLPGFQQILPLSPDLLIDFNASEVAKSEGRLAKNNNKIARITEREELGRAFVGELGDLLLTSAAAFGEYIIQWMLSRENGISNNKLLENSLQYKISPFWRTKVAFLIVSGNPDEYQISYLQKPEIGLARGQTLTLPLVRDARFKLLEEVLASYPAKAQTRMQQLEGTDPLIRAELQLQLALHAPDPQKRDEYLNQAEETIKYIREQLKKIFDEFDRRLDVMGIKNELLETLRKRFLYLKYPGTPVENQVVSELLFYQGQSQALNAQIYLQRAGKIDEKQKEAFAEIEKAFKLIKSSIPYIQGIHYEQAKQLAAECLSNMGLVARLLEGARDKDGKLILDLTDNETLKEIQAWEKKVFGKEFHREKSYRSYESFFRAADVLVRGTDKSVLDWTWGYYGAISEFSEDQFVGNLSPKKLWDDTWKDMSSKDKEYRLSFKSPEDKPLKRLNEIINTPNFYHYWLGGGERRIPLTPKNEILLRELEILIKDTRNYRSIYSSFKELEKKEKDAEMIINKIKMLNRILLELTYPQTCPQVVASGWLEQIRAFTENWWGKRKTVVTLEKREGKPAYYLPRQRIELTEVEASLSKVIGLPPDTQANIVASMVETIAQQGFISLNLAEREKSIKLFKRVKDTLQKILENARPKTGEAGDPSLQIKAEINLLLANILYVEAGNQDTIGGRKEVLKAAYKHIEDALKIGILHGPLLSYAHQFKSEILLLEKEVEAAEAEIKEAIRVLPQNYMAKAIYADILSQRGEHGMAVKKYQELQKEIENTHPHPTLVARIKLGRAEAKMRENENYLPENVAGLEKVVYGIFESEAPGSFLIPRAINSWIEALGPNEDLHYKIILICSALLGKEYGIDEIAEEDETAEQKQIKEMEAMLLKSTLEPFRKLVGAFPRLKAALYFKLADAFIWRKKYELAKEILENEIPKIEIPTTDKTKLPKKLLTDVIEKDIELKPWYKLAKAELPMKRDRTSRPVMDRGLEDAVLKLDDLDSEPDLMVRLVFDQIEGLVSDDDLSDVEKFSRTISQARKYQREQLERIKGIFMKKGRPRSAARFEFELWMKLAGAMGWHGGALIEEWKREEGEKEYRAALLELKQIYAETEKKLKEPPVKDLKHLYQAQVYINRGDVYFSEWSKKNYEAAKEKYLEALRILENIELHSKDYWATLSSAYTGLGEIYNFAQGELKNYEKAKHYYEKAIEAAEMLPKLSEKRDFLLHKIYLGLTKLNQQWHRRKPAVENFKKAEYHLTRLPHEKKLKRQTEGTGAFLKDRPVKVEYQHFQDSPRQGPSRSESRISLTAQLVPWENYTPASGVPALLLVYQQDSTKGETRHSFYVGQKWRFLELFNPEKTDDHSLTLEAMLRVWKENVYTDPRATIEFFRVPNLVARADYENKHLTVGGSLESYFGQSFINNSWGARVVGSITPDIGNFAPFIQFGAEYNHYLFIYRGEQRRRDDFNSISAFSIDLAELRKIGFPLAPYDYDKAKFRFFLGWPNFFVENGKFPDPGLNPLANIKIGAALEMHLGWGIVLAGDCSFTNQGKEYRYGLCSLSLRR